MGDLLRRELEIFRLNEKALRHIVGRTIDTSNGWLFCSSGGTQGCRNTCFKGTSQILISRMHCSLGHHKYPKECRWTTTGDTY